MERGFLHVRSKVACADSKATRLRSAPRVNCIDTWVAGGVHVKKDEEIVRCRGGAKQQAYA